MLILGANGFIGRALRRHLTGHYRLLCVDKESIDALEGVEEDTLQADLGDREQIDNLFESLGDLHSICAIVHLAAYYDFSNQADPRYRRLEAQLPHLLNQLDNHTRADAPLIYASSMAALAPTEPGCALGPDAPRAGLWAYPEHKLESERILENHRSERTVVELVLAGVYSDAGELVPLHQQIKRIAAGSIEAMFYPGPTDRGLTYVHIDDTVDAFKRAMEVFSGTTGQQARLMIGENRPVTYRTIHDTASQFLRGRRLPLIRVPRFVAWFGAVVLLALARLIRMRRFVRPWMVRFAGEHFELDIEPTRERIGWKPHHSMPTILEERILPLARDDRPAYDKRNEARPW